MVTGPGPGAAAHAARPSAGPRARGALAAAVIGLAAAGAAIVGLVKTTAHTTAVVSSAKTITASPRIPLTGPELVALTGRPAEYGPLADPQRRAACLRILGYPETVPVLGARTLGPGDATTVVLVLAGRGPDDLVGLQVRAECGTGPGGLVGKTSVRRS